MTSSPARAATTITALLLMLLTFPAGAQPAEQAAGGQAQALLEQGLQAEKEGRTLEALRTWERARATLEVPSTAIGRQYIRLATEVRADSLYDTASEMYFWGLSAGHVEPNRRALAEEIAFLDPLATTEVLNSWRGSLERGDPAVYRQLTGFWKSLDPTLSTPQNERLLEHWERIAHARRHFTRGQDTAYGTDPRGDIYLRYGAPDRTESGVLQYNASQAKSLVLDIIQSGLMDPTAYQRLDSPIKNYPNAFARAAQNHHMSPSYVIWIYEDLRPEANDNTIFTFGSDAETGSFVKVTSIEDFIPNEAFSMGSRQIMSVGGIRGYETLQEFQALQNIRVGVVLQMMYYDQLSTVDAFFGDMAMAISSRLNERGSISKSLGEEFKTRSQLELNERRLRSPREKSEARESMRDIPVEARAYRLLGEDGKPMLAVFARSRPQQAYLVDYLYNYDSAPVSNLGSLSPARREQARSRLDNYRLIHQVRAYGPSWTPDTTSTVEAGIVLHPGERTLTRHLVPHTAAGALLLVGAELHNRDAGSSYRGTAPSFPPEMRGSGTAQLRQPRPLTTHPDSLEMGDLVLGYDMGPPEDQAGSPDAAGAFPFTVSHDQSIPAGKELVLHVEAYHLQQDENGITNFELSYQVLKPNTFMTWLRGDYRTTLELTLNQQTDTPRYEQNLQIKTRKLEPGDYLLRMQATDTRSGQTVQREVEFTVTGP